jgi:predicted P-loop ATPase
MIRGDTNEAIEFLRALNPSGAWHLVAMQPDGKPIARTFQVYQIEQMKAWIDSHQGESNMYFHVNRLKPSITNRKALRSDIDTGLYLHADLDDVQALASLERFSPRPTAVLFSGGGYQAFWRLAEPCSNLDTLEEANKRLAAALQGDKVQNADRLMRLPGTINLPNAKKRKAGRKPALAKLCSELTDWARTIAIDEVLRLPSQGAVRSSSHSDTSIPVVSLDELPSPPADAVVQLIKTGDDPHNPRGTSNQKYPSRSEAVFNVICSLVRAGCTNEMIAGILINPEYGISESILEKHNPTKTALSQAANGRLAVERGWHDVDRHGHPRPTYRNTVLAIQKLGITGSSDKFRHRKSLGGRMMQSFVGDLSDDACAMLRKTIVDEFGFDPGKDNAQEAANAVCLENRFHPVRNYLDGLAWDGKPRLNDWLTTYLSADDTELSRAFGRAVLIAAVRRIRHPGTKFDTVLVLEGKQGTGKSTAIKILASPEFFSDQEILSPDAKQQMEALEGIWLFELSELGGMYRAQLDGMKAFISRTTDRGRPAWGRFREDRPRQVIFIATTNDEKYLRDSTGNRRFWPVKTGQIDLEALRQDRDQLWAEAAHHEAQGDSIIIPENLWPLAAKAQEERLEDDPWLDILANARNLPSHSDLFYTDGGVQRVHTDTLLSEVLGIDAERQRPADAKRLAANMRQLGWEGPKDTKIKGVNRKGYERPAPQTELTAQPTLTDLRRRRGRTRNDI